MIVAQNGKRQPRRLGIALNNRAIYVTSHKPQGRAIIGLLKSGIDRGDEGGAGGQQMSEVDLSRVVRVQLGQQSRRFVKAR
jgi:hypothetical protein